MRAVFVRAVFKGNSVSAASPSTRRVVTSASRRGIMNVFDHLNAPTGGPPSKAAKKRNKQRAKAAANKPQVVTEEPQKVVNVAPEPPVEPEEEDAGEGWNVRKSKGSKTSQFVGLWHPFRCPDLILCIPIVSGRNKQSSEQSGIAAEIKRSSTDRSSRRSSPLLPTLTRLFLRCLQLRGDVSEDNRSQRGCVLQGYDRRTPPILDRGPPFCLRMP